MSAEKTAKVTLVSPVSVHAEQEFNCIDCGYNLRTLSLDQNCPECGQLVAHSQAALADFGIRSQQLRRPLTILVIASLIGAITPIYYVSYIRWLYMDAPLYFNTLFALIVGYGLDSIAGLVRIYGAWSMFQAIRRPKAPRLVKYSLIMMIFFGFSTVALQMINCFFLANRDVRADWLLALKDQFYSVIYYLPFDPGRVGFWTAMTLLLWNIHRHRNQSSARRTVFSLRIAMCACIILLTSTLVEIILPRITRSPIAENIWWQYRGFFYWSGNGAIEFVTEAIFLLCLLILSRGIAFGVRP